MNSLSSKIWDINKLVTDGASISTQDIEIVKEALQTGTIKDCIIACEIVFRSSCAPELQTLAINQTKSICEQMLNGHMAVNPDILLLLLWIPQPTFNSSEVFWRLIVLAASNTSMTVRANAVMCLGRLIQKGNSEAQKLLGQMLSDPAASVRTNAVIVLQRLKTDNQ